MQLGKKQICQDNLIKPDSKSHFDQLISLIEDNQSYFKAVREASKFYNIDIDELKHLSLNKITRLYAEVYANLSKEEMQQCWLQNEKKLYLAILIIYLYVKKITIKQLNLSNYQQLQKIIHKPIIFLKYQAYSLIKINKATWTKQEDSFLLSIVKQNKNENLKYGDNGDWSKISKELFYRGDQQSVKNSKQCRQRWFTHVSPFISKDWTSELELKAMRQIRSKGKRWSKIAAILQTKSQHMVKNKYYSLLNKEKKNKDCLKLKEEQLLNNIINKLQVALESERNSQLELNIILPQEQSNLKMITSDNYQKKESDQPLFYIKSDLLSNFINVQSTNWISDPQIPEELKKSVVNSNFNFINQSGRFSNSVLPSPIVPTPRDYKMMSTPKQSLSLQTFQEKQKYFSNQMLFLTKQKLA